MRSESGRESVPYVYRGRATLTRIAADDSRAVTAGALVLEGTIVFRVVRSDNAAPTRVGERDFRGTGTFVADAPFPTGFLPPVSFASGNYMVTWNDAPGAMGRLCRVALEDADAGAVRIELRRA